MSDPREPVEPPAPETLPPPAPLPDEEQTVIAEREVVRQRDDGSIERDEVRVERRRKRPVDPIAVAIIVILLLVAAGGAAWWFLAQDDGRTVPSVEGLTVERAVARLQDEGFETSVERRADDAEPGTVFDQIPTGGTETDEGSLVQVIASSGPSTTVVPNAVGLTETEARDRLVAAGFEVSSKEMFAERDAGTIVSQSPTAGTQAAPGARVELVVSKGSGIVDVPQVVGLTRGEAQAELSSAGLEVNVVEVPSVEPIGIVVAQNPPGGQLQRGEAVRINVSRGQ